MVSEKIIDSLNSDCGHNPNRSLVVGVSGGADSLALLHCLVQAGVKVIPAHFDHGLRTASDKDARAVVEIVGSWGLRCVVGRQNVGAFAKSKGLGLEEAARVCRYKFLFETARKRRAEAIVVAHHADDQVETVLMHFLRGAGLNGLSGMQPVTILKQIDPDIPVFRPMLNVFKDEILAYCAQNGLKYLTDETNDDPSFFRNRMRAELIPVLQTYNPAIRALLHRNAKAIQSDRAILDCMENQKLESCLLPGTEAGVVAIDRKAFQSLEKGWQRRVILRCVTQLKPETRDFGFERVERVMKIIEADKKGKTLLPGIEMLLSDSQITFQVPGIPAKLTNYPQLISPEPASLGEAAPLQLQNGWTLHAALISAKAYKKLQPKLFQDPKHAFVNPADLEWPLKVRPRRDGEIWSPLGMGLQHQKLSDFLINNKIPQAARALWPLVFSEGSLIWVAGLRIAQPWRLHGDEPQVLHLWLTSPE